MAYNDFFGDINNCLGVSPTGVLKHTVGAGDPVIIYAVGTIQVSITLFDALCLPTATAATTFEVETAIAPAGYVALTDAMNVGVQNVPARAATWDTAQQVVGPADAIQIDKGVGNNTAIVFLSFFLN